MEHNYRDLLKDVLEKNKDEYLNYLKDLVAIDTQDVGHGILGGREAKGQEYLEELCKKMSADKIVKDPMTEEAIRKCYEMHKEGNLGHNYDNRYNLYADFKASSDKSLMFNGHIDTMPPGDERLWTNHPYKPTIKDGKLYGLGSADMKSGLVAGLLGVKLLQDAGIKLPINVKFCSVCDEEGGGNGSMQAIMSGEKADYTVVCEPTDRELIIAHMGFVFFKVEIEGRANHSGQKWAGVSAIDKAIKCIMALEELEHGWLLQYKHPLLPAPNLNVGTIHGGSAGSTVASDCYFECCIHYLPKQMDYDKIYEEFNSTIERLALSDPWLSEHKPKVTMYQSGGAFEQDENSKLVSSFKKAYEKAFLRQVDAVGSPAGCDSRLWKNIAASEVVQYGPGRLKECHAIDEYVDIEQFYEAIMVYALLILELGT